MRDFPSGLVDWALVAAVGAFVGMVAAFCGARFNRAQDAAIRPAPVYPEIIRYTATPEAEEPAQPPAMRTPVDRLIDEDFLAALAAVESGGDDSAVNIREDAHGRFQVRAAYLADANRILGSSYTLAEMHDRAKAERVVLAYLRHYGTERGVSSLYDLARIHNGGPKGAEKRATLDYGARVWETLARIRLEARHA